MFEKEIAEMTEDEKELFKSRWNAPDNSKWTVTFFFESFEQLDSFAYQDIPVPVVNSKLVIRNTHLLPNPHYNYEKRNYWTVKEVLPVLRPSDTTKDNLCYEHKINYEVYLIRSED